MLSYQYQLPYPQSFKSQALETDNPMSSWDTIDYGPDPFVLDVRQETLMNDTFRTTRWTGGHMQLTMMSILPGQDIGQELHPELDQFVRVEDGQGLVQMGTDPDNLDFQKTVFEGEAFFIPAGTWHNLLNTGTQPLKIYSIYAPAAHPRGTVNLVKDAAEPEMY